MCKPIIEVCNLTKAFRVPVKSPGLTGALKHIVRPHYEQKIAVNAISFEIEAGETVAYLGPNGAGKSTTLKMLTGILVPTSGTVEVAGFVPYQERMENNRNIGVVFGQRSQLWWDLPVQESLRLLGDIYEVPAPVFERNINEFIDLLELGPLLSKPARQLSLGQRMRCDLAASLLHSPPILYLDEPTIGLDVAVRARMRKFIRRINTEQGCTVLLASHDIGDIEDICQRLIMINEGVIIYDGPLETVKQRFGQERTIHLILREPVPNALQLVQEALQPDSNHILIQQSEDHHLLLRFDESQLSTASIVNRIMLILPVNDLQIEETTVESIIQKLYEGKLLLEGARNDSS